MLASPPELAPKEASGTLFDQPTTYTHISPFLKGVLLSGRTTSEESVFGEDSDGVDEENRDLAFSLVFARDGK